VKYIAKGSLDPGDVFMSLINHYGNHTPEFYELMNGSLGRMGDPFPEFDGDIHKFWRN